MSFFLQKHSVSKFVGYKVSIQKSLRVPAIKNYKFKFVKIPFKIVCTKKKYLSVTKYE